MTSLQSTDPPVREPPSIAVPFYRRRAATLFKLIHYPAAVLTLAAISLLRRPQSAEVVETLPPHRRSEPSSLQQPALVSRALNV